MKMQAGEEVEERAETLIYAKKLSVCGFGVDLLVQVDQPSASSKHMCQLTCMVDFTFCRV